MKEQKINRVMNMLSILREINPDMNVNMMLTLFEVAKGQGVTGRKLEDALDMNHATAARMLRYFDRLQSAGKPGLDLFRVELDPLDYKAKLRFLNKNGVDLMARLEAALDGN